MIMEKFSITTKWVWVACLLMSIIIQGVYAQGGHGHGHGYGPPRMHARSIRVVPRGAVIIKHRNVPYHYHRGYYYRPYGPSYRIVGPPAGVRIRVLPVGYYRWTYGPRTYFYYGGTYYTEVPAGGEYEVIIPPVGSIVPSIPDNAGEVVRNGEKLYEVNGVLYRSVETKEGTKFEVVGVVEREK